VHDGILAADWCGDEGDLETSREIIDKLNHDTAINHTKRQRGKDRWRQRDLDASEEFSLSSWGGKLSLTQDPYHKKERFYTPHLGYKCNLGRQAVQKRL
jgi:hypothetical protein